MYHKCQYKLILPTHLPGVRGLRGELSSSGVRNYNERAVGCAITEGPSRLSY